MTRFLHTSDWQLGMTRHFLREGAQEMFAQARIDAIRKLGEVAMEKACSFVVVSGDVFESNQVDRRTVVRALEALGQVSLPVYLLPGNHDPLNEGSVYRSQAFLKHKPSNIHVLEDECPIEVEKGVEVVGAPWATKKLAHDTVALACAKLAPGRNLRICVGHGIVDAFSPNTEDPSLISLKNAEKLIGDGIIQYLALGDRHSASNVGTTGRIWYSGSPESTDFGEVMAGMVLVVSLDDSSCQVEQVPLGTWQFIEDNIPLNSVEDLQALREQLNEIGMKEKKIIKLRFEGTLNLTLRAQLEELLAHYRDLLGALEVRDDNLVIIPDDADFSDLCFSGFAKKAVEDLKVRASETRGEGEVAKDALALLIRLAGGVA